MISSHSLAAIQYYCAENDHQFFVNEEEKTVEVKSSLHGRRIWLSVNTPNEGLNKELQEKVTETLAHHGVEVMIKSDNERIRNGDLLIELLSNKPIDDHQIISIGYNEKLNSINVKKNLSIYGGELQFKGYYLLQDQHDIPHLRCSLQSTNEGFILKEGSAILITCVLQTLLGNRKPSLLDLNVLHLLQTTSNRVREMDIVPVENKKVNKNIQMDDQTYEELKMRKANRKVRETQRKKASCRNLF